MPALAQRLRFGPDWSEDVELRGGERVRLRVVRPDDKQRIEAGLLRMSPQSQYLRFFTTKARFTTGELRYLTELDGWNHFAIGVVRIEADGGEGEGVAVARLVRLPHEPEVGEPAIAVIDDMQRKGLGRVLLCRLVAAAIERDIRTFRTEFLAVNQGMRGLVQSLVPNARFVADGSVVTAEFPLPSPARDDAIAISPQVAAMRSGLRLAADRSLEVRRLFAMLFDPEALEHAWHELRRRLGLAGKSR